MRPLVLHYENDPEVWNLNGEFLVGENLLVAPVLEQGETKKIVYLPEGTWYDYETKKPYQGRQYYMVDAPLDTCPMFVKEGGMIPTYELAQYVGEKPYDTLKMRVYPARELICIIRITERILPTVTVLIMCMSLRMKGTKKRHPCR